LRRLLPLVGLALAACSPELPEPRVERFSRLLVLGVDGATWKVAQPLIERGELPNLARLRRDGVVAPLRSLPDFGNSAVLWTSIVTGLPPERHGIEDFIQWDPVRGRAAPVQSGSRQAPALWNLLDAAEIPVGVIGLWVTWPAETLSGPRSFIVSERFPDDDRRDVTHPDALAERLDPDRLEAGWPPREVAEALAPIYDVERKHLRVEGADHLQVGLDTLAAVLRADVRKAQLGLVLGRHYDPDLLFNYIRAVDVSQHFLWPSDEAWVFPEGFDARASVESAYRFADRVIGMHLEALREDATVLVVSDHGARSRTRALSVLADADATALLPLDGLARVEERWYRSLGIRLLVEGRDEGGVVPPEDFERVRGVLEERLLALETREGEPALRREDDDREDLMFSWNLAAMTPRSEVRIGERWVPLSDLVNFEVRTGRHERDGLLAAMGPPFRKGVALQEASVLDVLPTLMALLDQPVADDLPGRPLLEALTPEFRAAHPLRRVASYGSRSAEALRSEGEDARTLQQLEALGYLERPADAPPEAPREGGP
jgi:predicted AlkP superfamily phosphohydrolase/phosphomutase